MNIEPERKAEAAPPTAADRWMSLFIAVIVALVSVLCLGTASSDWGDDPAAYLTEGFAIAEGRLEEQAELNVSLHPTKLPENMDGGLVYAWGFPLLLAAVYKLVGWDTAGFGSLIYYKIPSAILLGMTAAVLFLFLRRRFGREVSLIASLGFGLCYAFVFFVDMLIDTEMLFMLLSVSVFFLIDLCLTEKSAKRRAAYALVLGVLLWMAYETRPNGVTLLFALLLAQIVQLVPGKKFRMLRDGGKLICALLPYAVCAALIFASRLALPEATSFSSDFRSFDLGRTVYQIGYYAGKICVWLGQNLLRVAPKAIPQAVFLVLGIPGAALALWGMLTNGAKENLHLTVCFLGTVVGAAALPYLQGLRYMYGVLPILVMYVLYGSRNAAEFLRRRRGCNPRLTKAAVAALCLYAALPGVLYAAQPKADVGPFSAASVEAWHYLQNETDETDVIFFEKPRMLYLNTGRRSVWGINGHTPEEADYYLTTVGLTDTLKLPEEYGDSFSEVWRNDAFALYRKNEAE